MDLGTSCVVALPCVARRPGRVFLSNNLGRFPYIGWVPLPDVPMSWSSLSGRWSISEPRSGLFFLFSVWWMSRVLRALRASASGCSEGVKKKSSPGLKLFIV